LATGFQRRRFLEIGQTVSEKKIFINKKTFTYSGPKLWNELPFSIQQASSHNAFNTKVKSHFK
jgi:hypothetical protein